MFTLDLDEDLPFRLLFLSDTTLLVVNVPSEKSDTTVVEPVDGEPEDFDEDVGDEPVDAPVDGEPEDFDEDVVDDDDDADDELLDEVVA